MNPCSREGLYRVRFARRVRWLNLVLAALLFLAPLSGGRPGPVLAQDAAPGEAAALKGPARWAGRRNSDPRASQPLLGSAQEVDETAPGAPIGLQASPIGWTNQNLFTFSWTNPDDPSGISQAFYKLGGAPSSNSDFTGQRSGSGINQLADISLPAGASGIVGCYIWLQDEAGNVDYASASRVDVSYDPNPPVTVSSATPPYPADGWYSGTVTINLSATDSESGVKETRWRPEGGAWSTENPFSVASSRQGEYQSEDWAGNVESAIGWIVRIDKVAPTSVASLFPAPPASGWYNAPVEVRITASDDKSGVKQSYTRFNGSGPFAPGGTAVVTQSGSYSLEFYSRDLAGNSEPVQTQADYFKIDLDPPTVTATTDKPGPWTEPPVQVTIHADDGTGSGVAAIEYRAKGEATWTAGATFTVTAIDGSYTFEYRARDRAGNSSAIGTIKVGLDTGAPGAVTNLAATPAGWSNNPSGFGLSWSNPSEASGIGGAYYQIDIDPLQGGTATFVAGAGIQQINGIAVSSEGEHTAYLWVRDQAGNSDPNTRKELAGAFKYDATAPYCDEPTIVGPREDGKHYTGPVRLTITGRDLLSGIAAIHYQIEGEPVVTATVGAGLPTAQYSFSFVYTDTRKLVYYWATDTAGNTQASHNVYPVYFDTQAPASPIGVTVTPSGWVSATAFTVTWTNPYDYSGVAGAYYKMGSAPQWPSDGTYTAITGTGSISAQASKEGATPLYLWLKDKAGNSDYRTAAMVTVQRDATPPETTLEATGPSRNGYYTGPLTLTFASTDALSGVKQTRYRINGAEERVWDGQAMLFEAEGAYRVTYYAVDEAGNREVEHTQDYTIDLHAPVARITADGGTDYVRTSSVRLRWSGSDGLGSGIARYTVEYRRGKCAAWQSWYSGTDTSRVFSPAMIPNNYYYFRVKAEDRAGYVSEYSIPDRNSYIYYEGLINNFFDAGTFNGWSAVPDGLGATIANTASPYGSNSYMAQLGKDWPIDSVPKDGYAALYQQIQLPVLDCSEPLVLSFWYRVYSRDVMWGWVDSQGQETWIDTFDVYIKDASGNVLAHILRDGNDVWDSSQPGKLHILKWKRFTLDLSQWTQQPIRIEFRVDNRWDTNYPTWVLIDEVQLLPSNGRVVRLPIIITPPRGAAAVSSTEPTIEVAQPSDRRALPQDPKGLPSRR